MSSSIATRVDPIRSLLAGIAGFIALVAALLDANDLWMSFQEIVVPFLLISGFGAALFALLPTSRPWSVRRRTLAAVAAIAWAAIGIAVLPFGIAAAGCACATGPPGYVPPELLGMQARTWIILAIAGGPLLLLVAASPLPDRVHLRQTPR